jgi:hypothetical protein
MIARLTSFMRMDMTMAMIVATATIVGKSGRTIPFVPFEN